MAESCIDRQGGQMHWRGKRNILGGAGIIRATVASDPVHCWLWPTFAECRSSVPVSLVIDFGSMYASRERAAGRQSDPYELEPDPDLYPPFMLRLLLSLFLPHKKALITLARDIAADLFRVTP